METLTRLAPARERQAPARKPTRESRSARRLSEWLAMPFTFLLALVMVLMVLPDLLRPRARRWDRFGDH